MTDVPLTFLFTDIVGSTELWQRFEDEMADALERHDRLIRETVRDFGGVVFAGGGDGFGVVFASADRAVEASLALQESMADLRVGFARIAVRIGIHTGPARRRDGDYFGLTVHRAARITGAAAGGQILASAQTVMAAGGGFGVSRLGEFRLADLLDPIALYQIGAGSFPPVEARSPETHNLPVRFTPLIGRDQLLQLIDTDLSAHRLVTLVGPAGVGKTSLAIAAGARVATDSRRPVWLVELDRIESGESVPALVASTVDARAGIEEIERIAAIRQTIVLDNAEHVADQVAELAARLLMAGTGVRLLVTSREALNVPGERVVEVEPLDVSSGAVELLLSRISQPSPDMDLIREIARVTDGLPLALELVAARASRTPLSEIVQSLHRGGIGRFSLRGVAERHRTTAAAIGWSVDLLDEGERRAFGSLGVFGGPFSEATAVAVTEAGAETIQDLVEKSLVARYGNRLRLLAPVRDHLLSSPEHRQEADSAWDRYADHVGVLASVLSQELAPRDVDGWLARFDPELDDVVTLATRLAEKRDVERLELVYWILPGPFGIRRRQLARLLKGLEPILPLLEAKPVEHRWQLFRHSWCLDLVGREHEAHRVLASVRRAASSTGDDLLAAAGSALLLKILSVDPLTAPTRLEDLEREVLAHAPSSGWWDPEALAFARGVHAMAIGDHQTALDLLEGSLPGEPIGYDAGLTLLLVARCRRITGSPEAALASLDDILVEDESIVLEAHGERVHALLALGRLAEARQAIEVLTSFERGARGRPSAAGLLAVADYLSHLGDHRRALWCVARISREREVAGDVTNRVLAAADQSLGSSFGAEWERGAELSEESLLAMIEDD